MPSMRSAAELKAPTTASEAALARSAATTRASCKAATSSSSRRILRPASASSSATISAAITVSRVSPISPNLRAQLDDALVDVVRERLQVLLLPVLAGEAELAAGNGGVDLRHQSLHSAASVRLQHRLDRGDGRVQPLGDLAVGRLQPARARGLAVERGGELRAVEAERLQLARRALLAAVGLAPPLDRGIERIERQRQALHRIVDCALLASSP